MGFRHKRRHPDGYYDFPFGRCGGLCIGNVEPNLRNAYCLSDQRGCFSAVFFVCVEAKNNLIGLC